MEREGDNVGIELKNTLADVDFRFHFKAKALGELYDAGHLAIVHACGLTNGTRSHFDAIDFIERGTPDNKNTPTGWLTRFAVESNFSGITPVISSNNSLPTSLLSCQKAIAIPNVKKMQLQGDAHYQSLRASILKQAYNGDNLIAENGASTLGMLDIFAHNILKDSSGKQIDYVPSANAQYPTDGYTSELANSLKTIAQTIKMNIGTRVATADYGGWDTHIWQNGRFPNLVDGLSRSLAAFWADMGEFQDRLTIVVMSEFGRRLKGNESGGTDHGHGGVMLVLGGKVNGGNIYGEWPTLETEKLDNQVDLAVTTDYRDVLGEIIASRFNQAKNMNKIFLGFNNYKPLGFIKT